jgi:excinuclease ABC subunit C
MDVFGTYRHLQHAEVAVLRLAKGSMVDSSTFSLGTQDEIDFITPCMLQFYLGRKDVPPLIYADILLEDKQTLEAILSDLRGNAVSIRNASRGRPRQWVAMAQETALNNFRGETSVLDEIARVFRLPSIPYRMECYDISNLFGEQAVGARVVFIGGQEEKSLYRHYRIQGVSGQDDFAMLHEVLRRRFRDEAEPRPDLLVIDGGKGQLNICLKVLKELDFASVPVVAMAKERVSVKDRFFLPGRKDALAFPRGSNALKTLQRLRDEAHRFAITYHRRLRSKTTRSVLEDIPGIGPKKTNRILKHIPNLSAVTEDELLKVKGLSRKDVALVLDLLKTDGKRQKAEENDMA